MPNPLWRSYVPTLALCDRDNVQPNGCKDWRLKTSAGSKVPLSYGICAGGKSHFPALRPCRQAGRDCAEAHHLVLRKENALTV